jgi:hypothetical protein
MPAPCSQSPEELVRRTPTDSFLGPLHGFEKKRDDLPPKEKKLAKSYRSDYKQRVKEGTYYEQAEGLSESS